MTAIFLEALRLCLSCPSTWPTLSVALCPVFPYWGCLNFSLCLENSFSGCCRLADSPPASWGSSDTFVNLTETTWLPRSGLISPWASWAPSSASSALMPTKPTFAHLMVPTGFLPSLPFPVYSPSSSSWLTSASLPSSSWNSAQVYCRASLIKLPFQSYSPNPQFVFGSLSLYIYTFS